MSSAAAAIFRGSSRSAAFTTPPHAHRARWLRAQRARRRHRLAAHAAGSTPAPARRKPTGPLAPMRSSSRSSRAAIPRLSSRCFWAQADPSRNGRRVGCRLGRHRVDQPDRADRRNHDRRRAVSLAVLRRLAVYLAEPFACRVTAPSCAIVERRGNGGLLISAARDVYDGNDAAQVEAANAIDACLAPLKSWPND